MNSFLKKRPLVISGIVGLIIGVTLIVISFNCDKAYQIPNAGGYTSEDVWLCLSPLAPTIIISYLFQTILQIKEPGIGFGFFIFHIVFYSLVGLSIGWIVWKIKKDKI